MDLFGDDEPAYQSDMGVVAVTSFRNQPTRANHRGGVLLISVLVCMGIVSSMALTAMAMAVRSSLQLERQHQMEQTRWLAQAGLQRVWEADNLDELDGDVWNVVDAMPKYNVAEVKTRFDRDDPANTIVRVTATIALNDQPSSRTRYTLAARQIAPTVSSFQEGQP